MCKIVVRALPYALKLSIMGIHSRLFPLCKTHVESLDHLFGNFWYFDMNLEEDNGNGK